MSSSNSKLSTHILYYIINCTYNSANENRKRKKNISPTSLQKQNQHKQQESSKRFLAYKSNKSIENGFVFSTDALTGIQLQGNL